MSEVDVLYQDNHLLVVNKPARLPTMGVVGQPTLHMLACDYIRRTCNKPNNVYLGIVSRLDAMTSGVIVLARTSKAASRLTPQFANHSGTGVEKTYLAVVEGEFAKVDGECIDAIYKDDAAHRMRVARSPRSDAKQAHLRYRVSAKRTDANLVQVQPLTGRKHQIRLQLAEMGHPIFGDRKYDSDRSWADGIALHSWKLSLNHPTTKERMNFIAPPPRCWKAAVGELLQQGRL